MKLKRPQDMPLAELRAAAEDQGLQFYKQKYEQNQTPEAKAELENYCAQRGIVINPEVNRLYGLPKDKLAAEWEARGKAAEDQTLEAYRDEQAKIWLASQPRYTPNPAAAGLIVDRINSLGLKGSVHEIQYAFDQLVAEGKIEAAPEAVALCSPAEFNNLSAAEMRAELEKIGFGYGQ